MLWAVPWASLALCRRARPLILLPEVVLERALTAYYRGEGHGEAMVSHPDDVLQLIETAAGAVQAANQECLGGQA